MRIFVCTFRCGHVTEVLDVVRPASISAEIRRAWSLRSRFLQVTPLCKELFHRRQNGVAALEKYKVDKPQRPLLLLLLVPYLCVPVLAQLRSGLGLPTRQWDDINMASKAR